MFLFFAILNILTLGLLSGRRRDIFAEARELQQQFQSLGNMTGMTREDIVAVTGPPNSCSFLGRGRQLAQWQATGYHIAILFDAQNRFVKITHEYVAR